MKYIDTHCHLENDLFDDDRDQVIQRASHQEIYMITSAIDYDTWTKGLAIAQKYDSVFLSIGLDPTKYQKIDGAIDVIQTNESNIVSIGEIGLDHYQTRDHGERDKQEEAFRKLIKLATEMKLPIQIHSRSAGRAALEVLDEEGAEQVHMHAFDGKASLARMASNELGYYFSIPTSIIRSPQKQKLVKAVNIEKLLIETDSPVLAPERRERNTPLNLPLVLQEVARILRRDEEELREIVLENTLRFYKRLK